ncbi:MAG TPA: DUF2793 domain-containing protein [Thermohalobaculum sp.]|nr:DUF2793 domain-containing protein [Thermohalobaculum sp.]
MSDTQRFAMPLLDAAQAQKHVTVNEALARIDALAAGQALTVGETVPPASPADGDMHVVGTGASGLWAGQDKALAIFANGGWLFVPPWTGARVWDVGGGGALVFNGSDWIGTGDPASPSGAATVGEIVEVDHVVGSGPTSTAAGAIPDKAIVFGVTGRVTEAITGASGWKLGTPDGIDRYGSGLGVPLNSFVHGVSGTPLAYYGGTDLLLTAEGADFSGGRVLLAIHLTRLVPPAAV